MADEEKELEQEQEKGKLKTAVALEYELGETAPKIVATGKGHVAEKIIETAIAGNVPLHKDEKLANTLSKLEIGDYIPEELYGVVAEILVMVDRAEGKKKALIGG
jgi:flagellar biosynthesis protein